MLSLVLTGTPVQNNLVELWSLLHFLYPTVFTERTESVFKTSFDISKGTYALPFIKAAQQLLNTIMLRRTKNTIALDVPPREELTVFIPMTEAQRFWTYRLLTRMDSMGLHQIFESKIEDTAANEGRREVLTHLENELHNKDAGPDASR